MKYLVTGASGFIGKNLCEYLDKNNLKYATCGRSNIEWSKEHYILDLAGRGVGEMMTDCKPDVILHLAGNASGRPDPNKPNLVFEDNVFSTHNLLLNAPKDCRFVLASTIVVYGNMTGKEFYEYNPRLPTTPYGLSKLTAEHLVRMFTSQGKVNGVCARIGATVGKGLTHGVVYDFIKKIRNNPTTLELIGHCPGSVKPYNHVNDIINGLMCIAHTDARYTEYNLCNRDNISILELADAVLNAMQEKRELKWLDTNWIGDNPVLKVNNNRLRSLGWKPELNSYASVLISTRENL